LGVLRRWRVGTVNLTLEADKKWWPETESVTVTYFKREGAAKNIRTLRAIAHSDYRAHAPACYLMQVVHFFDLPISQIDCMIHTNSNYSIPN
jgi:hypothetical protein